MLTIVDITKFSLQDYPNHTSCIVWFGGCNLRCQYCHNPEFITGKFNKYITEEELLNFLKTRVDLLDGVVLSGGECTLGGNDFIELIKKIKQLNFKIKIDTNGINFDTVKYLIENKLIDFVALDYKATKEKFTFITNNKNYDLFQKTLKYLIEKYKNKEIDLEIRTTIHTDLLNEDDINNIIKHLEELGYNGNYYIQNFRNDNKETLCNLPNQKKLLDKEKIKSNSIKLGFRNFF